MFYFLGIDIAGSNNTWVVALGFSKDENTLIPVEALSLKNFSFPEPLLELEEVVKFSLKNRVIGAGIDAPLSFSLIEDKKGFRTADKFLKSILPPRAKNWVVSYNALMAVPLRGLLLARKLSPFCGTIIETHPRASFYFCLPEQYKFLAFKYKKSSLLHEEKILIINIFKKFGIKKFKENLLVEGIIDAIFCALAVYFFHRAPEKLLFLPDTPSAEGYGPFVIIKSF